VAVFGIDIKDNSPPNPEFILSDLVKKQIQNLGESGFLFASGSPPERQSRMVGDFVFQPTLMKSTLIVHDTRAMPPSELALHFQHFLIFLCPVCYPRFVFPIVRPLC
jgi:hypothetical protein